MADGYKAVWKRIEAGEFENELPLDKLIEKHEKYQELTKKILQLQAEIQKLESDRSILVSDIKRTWDNRKQELQTKFKEALEEAYKMQNHPKKDKIWEKAWDDGHSSGWTEILTVYDELVELLL